MGMAMAIHMFMPGMTTGCIVGRCSFEENIWKTRVPTCQRFHALLARGRKIAKVKIEVQSDGRAGSDWRRAAGQKKGYRLLSFGSVDKLNCLFVSL